MANRLESYDLIAVGQLGQLLNVSFELVNPSKPSRQTISKIRSDEFFIVVSLDGAQPGATVKLFKFAAPASLGGCTVSSQYQAHDNLLTHIASSRAEVFAKQLFSSNPGKAGQLNLLSFSSLYKIKTPYRHAKGCFPLPLPPPICPSGKFSAQPRWAQPRWFCREIWVPISMVPGSVVRLAL